MRKIKKFPKLVIEEAKNLRKFATVDEKNQLDIKIFDPNFPSNCIYGLLTGNCYNVRATELIKQCAKRVYKAESSIELSRKLNGSPKKYDNIDRYFTTHFWSPIEVFIFKAPLEMNIKLIAFIKGERKTLK